jgi:hypothetical protein
VVGTEAADLVLAAAAAIDAGAIVASQRTITLPESKFVMGISGAEE